MKKDYTYTGILLSPNEWFRVGVTHCIKKERGLKDTESFTIFSEWPANSALARLRFRSTAPSENSLADPSEPSQRMRYPTIALFQTNSKLTNSMDPMKEYGQIQTNYSTTQLRKTKWNIKIPGLKSEDHLLAEDYHLQAAQCAVAGTHVYTRKMTPFSRASYKENGNHQQKTSQRQRSHS